MNHDPINPADQQMHAMLGELAELERAGVFNRTPINLDAAVQADGVQADGVRGNGVRATGSSNRGSGLRRILFVSKIAACLAIVVGAGSLWQTSSNQNAQLSDGNAGIHTGTTEHSLFADLSGAGRLVECVNGPAGAGVSSACLNVDLDSDGDIDLADFGALQRRQGRL